MQTEKLAINKEMIVHLFFAEKRNHFSKTYIQKILSITNVSGYLFFFFKPFFSDKNRVKKRTALVEDKNKIVSDKKLVAETFNKFFANIVPLLGLQCKDGLLVSGEHNQDPLEKIIEKFKQHPSIITINLIRLIFRLVELKLSVLQE